MCIKCKWNEIPTTIEEYNTLCQKHKDENDYNVAMIEKYLYEQEHDL